ncbi:MAG: hypothetical protein H7Y11_11455, partial [Armatimonadetes bacterium]|nr:hypothetical protein [Anaerolineae bacterium]
DGIPDGWSATRKVVKCNQAGKPAVALTGDCAATLKPKTGVNVKLAQKVSAAGLAAGDTVRLAGYVSGAGVTGATAKLKVKYADTTLGKDGITLDLPPGDYAYQAFSADLTLLGAVTSVKAQMGYGGAAGKATFDDLTLTRLNPVARMGGLVP